MARVYNFSAGPSVLPEAVLKKAADEMMDYQGSGQSVMEMSHRSKVYDAIIKEAEALLREVMNIPDNYKVLFLQGGASSQFAMIPLNLMNKSGKADYVVTGQWAKKAYKEASRYGNANVVASSEDKTFSYIPKLDPVVDNEIIYDYEDVNYIVSLTDSGRIEIDKGILEDAINEGDSEYSVILDSIESHEAEIEEREREEWERFQWEMEQDCIRQANRDFEDMMNDYDAWGNID